MTPLAGSRTAWRGEFICSEIYSEYILHSDAFTLGIRGRRLLATVLLAIYGLFVPRIFCGQEGELRMLNARGWGDW